MNILEAFEELDQLNETLADKAFNDGTWSQERINSFDKLYKLAAEIGYKVIGTEIHSDASKAIRKAAADHG